MSNASSAERGTAFIIHTKQHANKTTKVNFLFIDNLFLASTFLQAEQEQKSHILRDITRNHHIKQLFVYHNFVISRTIQTEVMI